MKHLHVLPALLFCAASCTKSPVAEAPTPGGQSGDDGSVPYMSGGQSGDDGDVPAPPPCTTEESSLRSDQPTVFGASAEELLARVAPDGSSPLFWVAYDALDVGTFTPDHGQTSLTLQIALRDQSVTQDVHVTSPNVSIDACPPTVEVPVHVELSTADGAFGASFDAPLEFGGAAAASLRADVGLESLSGSLAFDQRGEASSNWQFRGFRVNVQLWPGGSRGTLSPSLVRLGPVPPPPAASPPLSASDAIPIPAVPDHWNSVAVWPRRETCALALDPQGVDALPDHVAYAATDGVVGWSFADVVAALNARAARTLETSDGPLPVRFTLDAPNELLCASVRGSRVAFRAPGHLAAASSAVSSEFSQLAIESNYWLTADASLDGSAFGLLRWLGAGAAPESTDLIAATGLALDISPGYENFWWTWYGTDRRSDATPAWSTTGRLAVSGSNPQQAEQQASDLASGLARSGYLLDDDGNVTLRNDTLLSAEIGE